MFYQIIHYKLLWAGYTRFLFKFYNFSCVLIYVLFGGWCYWWCNRCNIHVIYTVMLCEWVSSAGRNGSLVGPEPEKRGNHAREASPLLRWVLRDLMWVWCCVLLDITFIYLQFGKCHHCWIYCYVSFIMLYFSFKCYMISNFRYKLQMLTFVLFFMYWEMHGYMVPLIYCV